MIEVEMGVDDEIDLVGHNAEGPQPGGDLFPRREVHRVKRCQLAEPPVRVDLGRDVQPGIKESMPFGMIDQERGYGHGEFSRFTLQEQSRRHG